MQQPFIIGITGGSASGKTTFLKKLIASFSPQEICLISQDNYYHPHDDQELDENGIINFDLPSSIDAAAYAQDVLRLKNGESFIRKEYTFNNPDIIPRDLEFKPAPIVVVEGIFVFHYQEIAQHLNLRVYIDAEEHVKLQRRIMRDVKERGYGGLDDVLYRYSHHVVPTYEKYIRPYKYDADLIIPNNRHFANGLDVLVSFLRTKIESNPL
ncbi:uridine kinase family protein [Adhaeribacter pallidiroseus]|uniref:Uridine kinase n=1 Tax=Adhaeribacter pallidiroseus TaxID=2072847 RepID=A0A369QG55_9BACT|nr:uridine kinase [Adhaeribacter pallidiroseus]RDC62216.1 Uridine kinase [Adhaeribacter pallidiroseus]